MKARTRWLRAEFVTSAPSARCKRATIFKFHVQENPWRRIVHKSITCNPSAESDDALASELIKIEPVSEKKAPFVAQRGFRIEKLFFLSFVCFGAFRLLFVVDIEIWSKKRADETEHDNIQTLLAYASIASRSANLFPSSNFTFATLSHLKRTGKTSRVIRSHQKKRKYFFSCSKSSRQDFSRSMYECVEKPEKNGISLVHRWGKIIFTFSSLVLVRAGVVLSSELNRFTSPRPSLIIFISAAFHEIFSRFFRARRKTSESSFSHWLLNKWPWLSDCFVGVSDCPWLELTQLQNSFCGLQPTGWWTTLPFCSLKPLNNFRAP